ncbi:MAG: hypothetical protein L3J31_00175 [Bacteroidales bacterium]|nr:hypothetical protein [Bacteroidales bacterium]
MTKIKLHDILNHRIATLSLYMSFVAILLLFFTIVYAHVFSSQLGTADDAAIALVARNLAEGNGYASSVAFDGSYGLDKFSAGITTGPTLILPAALLMVIFGNTLWVPGFVTATACLILLIFIFRHVQKQTNLTLALAFSTLLIFFFYNMTAGLHFVNWFVLLGELPATFLGILGVLILAASPKKRSAIVTACLLFGLAFTTKMLSFLGFLPLIAWFVYSLIKEKQNRKTLFTNYLLGALSFAMPYLLFEIWKLFSLGISAYIENWQGFIKLFGRLSGADKGISLSLPEQFLQRNKAMSNHFGFSMFLLIPLAVLTGFIVFKYAKRKSVRLLFALLMLGAFLHLFYWVFLSSGWHRYALIGLFLYFTALASLLFVDLPRPVIGAILIIFIMLFLSTSKKLNKPVKNVMLYGFHPNPRLVNLQTTVDFLKNYEQQKPFVSGWWATVVDVEYTLPTLQNFKRFDQLGKDDYNRELIVVYNTIYTNHLHFPGFDEWNEKCYEILLDAPPYIVSRYNATPLKPKHEITIDFSDQGNSDDYISYGWSKQEQNYRWTDGRNAGIVFSVLLQIQGRIELQLLGFPYLAKGEIDHQVIAVRVNEHLVKEWKLENNGWSYISIPANLLADDNVVQIDFEISNAASPESFGFSNDRRKLGLGVKKIFIKYRAD